MKWGGRGILVLDSDGGIVFSAGIACDSFVQSDLVKRWLARDQKPLPVMFSLGDLAKPVSVLSYSAPQSTCFIMHLHEEADPLFEFVGSVDFAADILRFFVTNPYEAVTVVDKDAVIRYMSPVHERFFGVPLGDAIGRQANEVIENSRLDMVLRTGKAEIGDVQKMRGTTRVVSRSPIFNPSGSIVGAIGQVMFKSPSALQALSSEINRLRQEISFYKRELPRLSGQFQGLEAIVGESDAIVKLKEKIVKIAPLDVPVLLVGESGVGKDLVAHAIHLLSTRTSKPLVLINAAALPTSLVEAELFGYEGGAFTGAERKGRSGKFEQADQGTLFLDEIGDMPLEVQVKLLRTLQDGTFQRVGGSSAKKSDFRLISASNRDFKSMLENSSFRLDLFYRISAVTIRVPALRDRLDDIPLLVETFLRTFVKRHGIAEKTIGPGVIEYLQSLPWPGNVRQLQHTVERAAIFSDSSEISVQDCEVPLESGEPSDNLFLDTVAALPPAESVSVRSAKSKVEDELIVEAMLKFSGNKKKVAEHLGISRSYLYKKLAAVDSSETAG